MVVQGKGERPPEMRATIRLHPVGMPEHRPPSIIGARLPDGQRSLWHPARVHCTSRVVPVVGPRSPKPTTGYPLATLRVDLGQRERHNHAGA